MKYTKHLILTILAMVMMANAWGMDIYIHYANGTWPASIAASNFTNGDLKVACESSDAISVVKTKIATLTGFIELGMTLSYGDNNNLPDNQTLSSLTISNGFTINLTYVDPTQPQRYGENRDLWHVQTMPRGNRVLRTTWKQDPALAWQIGVQPVPQEGVSGYFGFESNVTFPTLSNPYSLEVTYSSTNTNAATINANTGVITFVAAGETTIKAIFAGNDDYLPDTATYTLTVNSPYTLTLAKEGNGTVMLTGINGNHFVVPSNWENDNTTLTAADLPGFVPVTAEQALAWDNVPANGNVNLIYDFDAQGKALFAIFVNGSIEPNFPLVRHTFTYDDLYNDSQNAQFYYTILPEGMTAGSVENSYLVLPDTTVTVKATPTATSYVQKWDNDAAINSNIAVTKEYTITENTTAKAWFIDKPILTLASNDDNMGTVVLDGLHNRTFSSSNLPAMGTIIKEGDVLNFSEIHFNAEYWYQNNTWKEVEGSFEGPITVGANGAISINNTIINPAEYDLFQGDNPGNAWSVSASNDNSITLQGFLVDDPSPVIIYPEGVAAATTTTKTLIFSNNGSWNPGSAQYPVANVTYPYQINANTVLAVVYSGEEVNYNQVTVHGSHLSYDENTHIITVSAGLTEDEYIVFDNQTGGPAFSSCSLYVRVNTTSNVIANTYVVDYGTAVTINATANVNDHYHFVNWTNEGGTEYPTGVNTDNQHGDYPQSSQLTLTVTCDTTTQGNFAIDTFTLTLAKNNDWGSVTLDNNTSDLPEGVSQATDNTFRVKYGTTVAVKATASTGYHLDSWTPAHSENELDTAHVTVTKDTTLTAIFDTNTYALTVLSANEVMGSVTGSTTAKHFKNYPISATANYGYHFTHWNDNSTEASRSVTLTQDTTYTASFDYNQYTVTAATANETMGSASGTGTVNYLQHVNLTATANEGYHFEQWTEADTFFSANASIEVQALSNRTFVAHFAVNVYDVTVNITKDNLHSNADMGSVQGPATLEHFANADYTATANYGYHFVNWTNASNEELGTNATYNLSNLTGNYTLNANFTYNTYSVTAQSANATMGSTTGSNTVNYLDTVSLTATANYGYHFVNWTEGSTALGSSNPVKVVANDNRTISANFGYNQYTVTAQSANTTMGSVSGTSTVDYLTNVTLTATPETGYHFVQWTEADTSFSTDASIEVKALSNRTFVAHFAVNVYDVTVNITKDNLHDNVAMGTVQGPATLEHFANADYAATANYGYHFVNWTNASNEELGTNATYNLSNLTGNYTLNANFTYNTYSVTAQSANATMGSASGSNTVNYLDTVPLTATANYGYHFVNWTNAAGDTIGEMATIKVQALRDSVITANFTYNTYTVSGEPAVTTDNRGTVTGSQTVNYLTNVTLTATANYGYHFVSWINAAGDVLGNTTTLTVQALRDSTVYAVFDTNTYTLTVVSASEEMGSGNGSISAKHFKSYQISATPAAGHHFVRWNDGYTVNPRTVTLTSDSTFTAYFATTPANLAWSPEEFTGYAAIDFNNWKPVLADPYNVIVRYGCVEGNDPDNGGIAVDASTGIIGNEMNFGHATNKSGTFHIYAVHETEQNYYYDSVVYTLHVLPSALVELSPNIAEAGTLSMPNATNVPSLTHRYITDGNLPTVMLALDQSVNILAEPATGYHFNYWQIPSVSQEITTAAYTYQFTIPSDVTPPIDILTRTIQANFDTNTYVLDVLSADAEMGNGNGSTTAKHFLNYEISATPNTGYHFVQWNDGVTDSLRVVTLTSDSSFTAYFAPDTFTITYMDGETELNVDTFYYRQPITNYTYSKEGWDFTGWSPSVPALMPAYNLTVYAQWYRICLPAHDIDNNTYPVVNISNLCWMAANMRATHYDDGRDIANVYEYASPMYPNAAENVAVYGRLYDWYDAVDAGRQTRAVQVQGICPAGWRLPTEEDFAILDSIFLPNLRSTNYWVVNNGNNSTGLDLRPSGMYDFDAAKYKDLLCNAYLWSATAASSSEAHSRMATYYCDTLINLICNKQNAYSVRCVKD